MNTEQQDKLVTLTKKHIRSKILLRLKTQKEEDRNRKSKVIQKKLFMVKAFKKAKIVMFFISFAGEVKTKEMIKEAQKIGKIIAVPVCRKIRSMRPSILPSEPKFTHGLYEIYEPAVKKYIDLKKLDLVVVPGVAFDKKGNRLGRGKGYYDVFLDKLYPKTASIGLAFDFQILPIVPTASHDRKVNHVLFA